MTIIGTADARLTRGMRSHRIRADSSSSCSCWRPPVSVVAIAFVVGTIVSRSGRRRGICLNVVASTTSWTLIQTVFAFHYARRYYGDERRNPSQQAGGLAFPGGADPDYMDFAYYSFVVGMTSQVSDVQVLSPNMRRMTLVHGVLAFIFNIAGLALSINIIASAI